MRHWHPVPVLVLLLSGCASAVPDAATAIAIAKKQCGVDAPMGLPSFDTWDAQLDGNRWIVQASNQTSYLGGLSRDAVMVIAIPRDGSKPGRCGIALQY